jgi:hypothetical protein
MKSPKDDTEIRLLFERLREEEEPRIPPLDRILERRPAGREGVSLLRTLSGHRWIAATALLAVIMGSVLLLRESRNPGLPGDLESPATVTVARLMDWEAPTDFLLAPDQGDEVFQESVPTVATDFDDWSDAADLSADTTP